MDEVYATRKFLPGQIWSLTIDLEKTVGDQLKRRPYLIIASNNRRIIALKMTTKGQFSTNWMFQFKKERDYDSNIILDMPITVNINKIAPGDTYETTLSPDLFRKIMIQHFAAMLYQGMPDMLKNENTIAEINNVVDNHEDNLLSYCIYNNQYEFGRVAIEPETDEELDDTDDAAADEDDTNEVITAPEEPQPEVQVEPEIRETRHDDIIPDAKFTDTTSVRKTVSRTTRVIPRVEDIAIIGVGKTLDTKVFNECERIGINLQNAKFQLRQLESSKKLPHVHDKYGLTLKSSLKPSENKSLVVDDCEKFGVSTTAKIWNRTISGIRYYISNCGHK
jgi:hypothetical protein